MIIACPSCGTLFSLEDSRLGGVKRKVRCGSCGEVWEQAPPVAQEPSPPVAQASVPQLPTIPAERLSALPEFRAAAGKHLAPAPMVKSAPPRLKTALCLLPLLLIALLALGLILFRQDLAHLAPGLAPFYALIGLSVVSPAGY